MDWKERHAGKLVTVEQAIGKIARGRCIFLGSGAAAPARLVEGLVVHGGHLAGNEIVHLLTLGPAPYVDREMAGRFRHTAFFIGDNVRAAVQEGRADFVPVFLSDLPALIAARRIRVDVALIQVSPPDQHGFVSLGVSVDIVRAAIDAAELVIAEVNPRMPRTQGDSALPVDRLHHLVAVEYELPERVPEAPDEVDRQIGRHIASLIPDGATLQMGIGRVPNAVLAELGGRSDLGVHTEMFSDGVMRLVEAGVITGRKKTLLPGKLVTSFLMGSRALYDWAHDNPAIEMRPSSFTNDPVVIGRNDQMMAINAALAVDLTGQVAADAVAGKLFSGIGGQVDFIRGAGRSRGGKAIIALRSTAKEGTVSRICAALEPGASVVTTRGDVHHVVTEYGAADLWGKSIRQRAVALIELAHPDFRQALLAGAKERRYVFLDQVAPRAPYPWAETHAARLRTGEPVVVRPARLTDEEPLQQLFYRLSAESQYRRFFGLRKEFAHAEMQKMVDLDYRGRMALVACLEGGEIVGLVSYDAEPGGEQAEIAFAVRDDWQAKGLGTLLLERMTLAGRANGLRAFTADVLGGNEAMLSLFRKAGLPTEASFEGGVHHLRLRLA